MKHAITFRKQVINNSRFLRQPPTSGERYSMYYCNFATPGEPFNPKQLMNDGIDGNNGYDDEDMNLLPESETFDNLKLEMERAFGGDCDDSADEDDENDPGASVLFNYKEKSFKEDDISNFDSNIIITIPDEMRERKCDACRQRFMLKESFEQHLKECIELKLLKFTTEGYQLLSMRKSRNLSANEFVRRMIFSLKKMVKSLTTFHKEVSEDDKLSKKVNLFDLQEDMLTKSKKNVNGIDPTTNLSSIPLPLPNGSAFAINDTEKTKHFLNLLEGKPNVSIQKNHLLADKAQSIDDQSTEQMHIPNVSNATVSSGTGHSSILASNNNNHAFEQRIQTMSPLVSLATPQQFNKNSNNSNGVGNALNCMDLESTIKNVAANKKRQRWPPSTETTVILAQCSQCCESFSSLQQFEDHIRQFHNNPSSSSRSTSSQSPQNMVRIIDPFSIQDFNKISIFFPVLNRHQRANHQPQAMHLIRMREIDFCKC